MPDTRHLNQVYQCLHCGEPLRVMLRDGTIESQSPTEIQGYVSIPLREWARNWNYT